MERIGAFEAVTTAFAVTGSVIAGEENDAVLLIVPPTVGGANRFVIVSYTTSTFPPAGTLMPVITNGAVPATVIGEASTPFTYTFAESPT